MGPTHSLSLLPCLIMRTDKGLVDGLHFQERRALEGVSQRKKREQDRGRGKLRARERCDREEGAACLHFALGSPSVPALPLQQTREAGPPQTELYGLGRRQPASAKYSGSLPFLTFQRIFNGSAATAATAAIAPTAAPLSLHFPPIPGCFPLSGQSHRVRLMVQPGRR